MSSRCRCSVFDPRAGYGGALSTYFGLSSGLQLLKVENFQLLLLDNTFVHCFVNVDPSVGGNAYGGGVSVYMGGYSSSYHLNGDASAHVGDTSVRNVSLTLRTARFTSCSASRSNGAFGGNSFGGSFSFYLGAYSWSRSGVAGSSSVIGTTIARDLRIDISDAPCSNCSAVTASKFDSMGANSYGGSMSVVYIGGYAWSFSNTAGSNTSSSCGATIASGLSVSILDAACSNCSAVTTSGGSSGGANSYGGSMSVVYIGGYAWSFSNTTGSNTSSICGATTASGLSVSVRDTPCFNCSALTSSVFFSLGANSYGGSMSVAYIGGYTWSVGASINSCGATTASGLIVSVIDAACVNCCAVTTSVGLSNAANSYGGSMSVVYIGGYAWIFSNTAGSNSSSSCGATIASGLSVSILDAACSNCSAVTTSGGSRFGGNSYGGSMSVVHIGGYAWSQSVGASSNTSSSCGATAATDLTVSVRDVTCFNCKAVTTCGKTSHGASSYGGSMSVVYIGGYAWSLIEGAIGNYSNSTSSSCGATTASSLSVSIHDAPCTNCSAMTTSVGFLNGGNAYGGSMSVLYIVSFSESFSFATSNTVSRCETTNASRLSVSVIGAACSHCSAVAKSGLDSNGANSYGGSMSVAHIGGYAWSFGTRDKSNSSSSCGATFASGLSVSISDAACFNCSALTTSIRFSDLANSYGGSMSVVYIGGYAWSFGNMAGSNTSSICGATTASSLNVSILDAACFNCSAMTTSRETLFGANSYGGSMSVVYIGGTAWSYSVGDRLRFSLALCEFTHVDGLSVSISKSASQQSKAISRKFSVQVLYFVL